MDVKEMEYKRKDIEDEIERIEKMIGDDWGRIRGYEIYLESDDNTGEFDKRIRQHIAVIKERIKAREEIIKDYQSKIEVIRKEVMRLEIERRLEEDGGE